MGTVDQAGSSIFPSLASAPTFAPMAPDPRDPNPGLVLGFPA